MNARPGAPGWYVDAGYALNYATKRVQRKHGLVRFCGTSLVPNARDLLRLLGLDDAFEDTASQDAMVARVGPALIDRVLGDHQDMISFFRRHGRRMRRLPFRAVACVQENGENNTVTKGIETGLPLAPWFVEEFGLTRLTPEAGTSPSMADRLRETTNCTKSWLGFLRTRLLERPTDLL